MNPRGITVADDGTIYVAEAGIGGDEPDFPTSPVGSPAAASPGASGAASPGASAAASPGASAAASPGASGAASPASSPAGSGGTSGTPAPAATHGETGRVTAIAPGGGQTVLVDGLTSYFFGSEVVGPAGVALGTDGTVYVSIGGPGPGTGFFEPAGNADSVVSVDSSGAVTELANIGQYERENNPDPNAVDSNVGGMALGADGLLYVADSGGNDLYSVDPATGDLNVVAVFDGLPTPDGSPNPARGGAAEVDPVPTDVTADSSGGVLVGFLTGAILWGVPGSAKVVHVDPDGTVSDAVTGLDMVTGVAESDGTIYASQLSTSFTSTPPGPGQISWATTGGTPQTLFTNLVLPYGIALAPDGASMYIVVNATGEPGAAPNGQVIQCPLPGGAAASPSPSAPASPSASPSVAPTVEPTLTAEPSESASPVESATPKPSKTPKPTQEPSASAPAASESASPEASPTGS